MKPVPGLWRAPTFYKGCAHCHFRRAGTRHGGLCCPWAANDLLTITGVDASFVAVAKNGGVNISARSMGALNVQVILEPLGGGGHLTMGRCAAEKLYPQGSGAAHPGTD